MAVRANILGVLSDVFSLGVTYSSRLLLKRESATVLGVRDATDVAYANVRAAAGTASDDLVTLGQLDNFQPQTIAFVIDGGGTEIADGVAGDLQIGFDCTITGWTLLADQSGSIVVDVWKDTYANYPPTAADSITAAAKPTITADTKGTGSPTAWITAITAGDTLRFNVDSCNVIQRCTVVLPVQRPTTA